MKENEKEDTNLYPIELPTTSAYAMKSNQQKTQRRGIKRPSQSPPNKDFIHKDESNDDAVTTNIDIDDEDDEPSEIILDDCNVPIEIKSDSENDDDDNDIEDEGPSSSKKFKMETTTSETTPPEIVCHDLTEDEVVHNEDEPTIIPQNFDDNHSMEQDEIDDDDDDEDEDKHLVNATTTSSTTTTSLSTISTVNSTCDNNQQQNDAETENETEPELPTFNNDDHGQYFSFPPTVSSEIQQKPQLQQEQQHHHHPPIQLTLKLDNYENTIMANNYNEDEDEDVIEQKFNDAENYVLESGEVSTDDSGTGKCNKNVPLANKNSLKLSLFPLFHLSSPTNFHE